MLRYRSNFLQKKIPGFTLEKCIFSWGLAKEKLSALRWTIRRWTLRHCWYRLRLPLRRKRWAKRNVMAAQRIPAKRPLNRTGGPAIAFGEFSSSTGLGRGASYDLEYIKHIHKSLIIIDISDALKGHFKAIYVPDQIENVYFLCQPDTYWVIPYLVAPETLQNAYRLGRWAWEAPYFPQGWLFAETILHEVWAASEFCAVTFRSALTIPIKVVGYPVQVPLITNLDMRQRLGIRKEVFLGLAVMDLVSCPDRKNPWGHIKAWKQAFRHDSDCLLIMKLRVGRRTSVVVKELVELIGECKNIRILLDEMSIEEIAGLHRAADVYISLHRSEGFGLNIMESLIIGKEVIATHYSANTEFGPSFPKYKGIRYTLKPYEDWLAHYDGNFEYADPDIPEAAIRLHDARNTWEKR